MQHPPQSVTIRYSRNLLCDGQNDEFIVLHLSCQKSVVSGHQVGVYYQAITSTKKDAQETEGVGGTPIEALGRALEKHGVTFR